jgi:hypothetical protein
MRSAVYYRSIAAVCANAILTRHPNPREWLALDEQERMNLVKRSR